MQKSQVKLFSIIGEVILQPRKREFTNLGIDLERYRSASEIKPV